MISLRNFDSQPRLLALLRKVLTHYHNRPFGLLGGVLSGAVVALVVMVVAVATAHNRPPAALAAEVAAHAGSILTSKPARQIANPEFEAQAVDPMALTQLYKEQLPVTTKVRLDKLAPRFEALRPAYEQAAQAEGVPWQMLAAVHYREAGPGLSANVSTMAGERLGTRNPDHRGLTVHSFDEGLRSSARYLKNLSKSAYGLQLQPAGGTIEDTARAFVAYNRGTGYATRGIPAHRSPYVANGFDNRHLNMEWPIGDPARRHNNDRDHNLGAVTVYVYLGGPVAKTQSTPSGQ